MTITRNFKLCLNAGTQNAPYINANQYDEGEQWIFDLYTEGGQKFTPSTGAIIGIKSDGHAILNSGTVNSDGQVVITETQQMTAASGLAVFELLIEGETHGTANFIVNVERRPSDDAEFSDSDISMLQEAIDAAEVINEILDEGGDPSEIITENVNNWLDNHPEATTTVQDGAITAPKINNSLWDKILVNEEVSGNPASFDDGADDVPVSSLKVALEPIQAGSGDPSPSNVRPIIASNGKNLLQTSATTQTINGVTFTVNADGTVSLSGTSTDRANFSMPLSASLADGNYILSGCPSGGSSSTYYMQAFASGVGEGMDLGSGVGIIDPSTVTRLSITVRNANIDTTGIVFKPMIRRADIADASYQPYQGIIVERTGENVPPVSYPISLGREVYGGSVDLATGVLTVTHGIITFDGTQNIGIANWRPFSGSSAWLYARSTLPNISIPVDPQTNILCDKLQAIPYSASYGGVYGNNVGIATVAGSGDTWSIAVRVPVDGLTTNALINEWLANNPLQVVYELAEPQTYQLTPQEVKTLLGYNNISSNGTVDVIYHADTKLYIDKKIGELS